MSLLNSLQCRLLPLFVIALLSFHAYANANSQAVIGVWKTEASERGLLHVSFEQCGAAVCGTIIKAIDLDGESSPNFEHLGKQMVWDMQASGEQSWSGGKIWDPIKDKTYKSKMSLIGDVLEVSGCIAVFCRTQRWTRVEK